MSQTSDPPFVGLPSLANGLLVERGRSRVTAIFSMFILIMQNVDCRCSKAIPELLHSNDETRPADAE
jgi:hypothetical protein